jgi:hypothetical protein
MKRYIQKSLMLSAIIWIIVTLVSFLGFEYREEMKLNFLIVMLSFLSMGIHYFTLYIFCDSFLKELICKYVLIEAMVLTVGVFSGWFIKENWWMSFVYVTFVFVLAYLLGITQLERDVQAINQKLTEKKTERLYEK